MRWVAGGDVQPLFITIDPGRSPQILAEFVKTSIRAIVALRGTPAQTGAIARAMASSIQRDDSDKALTSTSTPRTSTS